MFINEECGIPKVVVDDGELTRNINQKNKSGVLQVYVHSVRNAIEDSISSISIWNIVNQLGKYDFSCGPPVVNNLKDISKEISKRDF